MNYVRAITGCIIHENIQNTVLQFVMSHWVTESNLPSVQISSTVLNIVFQRQEYIFNIYQEKGVFYFHDLAGAS